MDGFSYIDIFDTKGIEYLIVIAFLLLVIPFWRALNKPVRVHVKYPRPAGILSSEILNISQGLHYSKFHTWTHLEQSGLARVGVDDLLLHLTGDVKLVNLLLPGDQVRRGDPVAEIRKGNKTLTMASPVSGQVASVNTVLAEEEGAVNREVPGKDWICKINPANWLGETKDMYMGEAARNWTKQELENFKAFASNWMNSQSPESFDPIMQTGGELMDHPMEDMPADAWKDFQNKFLSIS